MSRQQQGDEPAAFDPQMAFLHVKGVGSQQGTPGCYRFTSAL